MQKDGTLCRRACNLDTRTGGHIIDLLFELNREEGTTLVLVTHNLHLATYTGRILTLKGGKLVEDRSIPV